MSILPAPGPVTQVWPTRSDERPDTANLLRAALHVARAAKAAANAEEVKVRERTWRDPAAGLIAFGTWANRW